MTTRAVGSAPDRTPANRRLPEDRPRRLRVGDLVEVRSAPEILATLDERGELDSLPFMPEMLQYCGRRFTVAKVAHKTCDTITGTGYRRMDDAVHLAGVRCDGSAHDGCQAACLIYWKTAWLRPVAPAAPHRPDPGDAERHTPRPPDSGDAEVPTPHPPDPGGADRLLPLLTSASRGQPAPDGRPTYRCQATELLRAAPQPLALRSPGHYLRDVRSGNVGPWWALRAYLVGGFNRGQDLSRAHLPRWLRFRQGRRWGFLRGTATGGTPSVRTDLRPGELVRVKPKKEIMKTLDANLRNRGLGFDAEMLRFCSRTARVERRVERSIDERTGLMRHMKNPCIVLAGVVCEGAYSANCPRSIPIYWRELWLERVGDPAAGDAQDAG